MFDRFEGLKKEKLWRVGRGHGSGSGKTSGHGVKGQKAREGVGGARNFGGGQNPLYTSLPKRGFKLPLYNKKKRIVSIPLHRLRAILEDIDGDEFLIDRDFLVTHGLISARYRGKIKLMGKAGFSTKFKVRVDFLTTGARESLEGAKVKILSK